jgi:hypothetical protein
MKDSIKILLSMFLLISVLTGKRNITGEQYNALAAIMLALFAAACFYDIIIALILVSIAFVMFSKVIIKESFDAKTDNADKDKALRDKALRDKALREKAANEKTKALKEIDVKKTVKVPKAVADKLPSQCSDVKELDEEFLKKYDINIKKLDDIQNNVFDKYNYDVYYNEMGEGSLDIQGVFNHEVIGYER